MSFAGRQKIVKAAGAEPDEFEATVAQELFNMEVRFFHYCLYLSCGIPMLHILAIVMTIAM